MLNAQVLINREWVELSGNPGSNVILSEWNQIDWTSSSFDSQGDLIVVGNTQQAAGNTDILVSKYNRESGTLVWETTYNGPVSGHDYGVSVLVDGADNVIVAGVVSTASGQSAVQLLKYSSSGSLVWSTLWTNPSGNLYDVPTAMTFDNSGNIIVIGGSINASLVSDWIILKFDSSGNILWNQAYDYASHQDLPTNVVVESNNNVSVLGFSEDMPSSVNFVGITFAEADGAILSQDIKPLPEISGTSPASVVIDANHDVYIAATTNDAANSNVKLIKISGSNLVWVKNIDEDGLADVAKSVIVDHGGSIVLATESENVSGGHYVAIRKYSSSGNELFLSKLQPKESTDDVRATKLRVDIDNNIFLLGEKTYSGDSDIFFSMYSSEGNILGLKEYSGDNAAEDHSRDIQLSWDGGIFVTGKSTETTTQYATIKYELDNVPIEVENDSTGTPIFRKNTVIVRFDSSAVIKEHIDNIDIVTAEVPYFLKQYAIDSINNRLGFAFERAKLIRVYKRLTTKHTVSISRLGSEIPVKPFWATFELVLPKGASLTQAISNLESTFPIVHWAEPNFISVAESGPNDPFFSSQESIYYNTFAPPINRFDVNVLPAWENYTSGKPFVKVGIFDTGIEHHHEDLNYTNIIGQPIPVVVDGWDFENDLNLFSSSTPDGNGHGTSVAGIIGAVKNNGKGIAGIAGGYIEPVLGGSDRGVSLYGLKVNIGVTDINLSTYIADAILTSAIEMPLSNYGYGLHIMNNSYSSDGFSQNVAESVEFANRNDVIFVAARGNFEPDPFKSVTDQRFPACYFDSWVLNVGGTDAIVGDYKDLLDGENWWQPYTHNGVDIGAPCIGSIIRTTKNGNNSGVYNNYGSFNGTSAATPHVSGAAALLLSYLNEETSDYNNLAQEDVEYVLKASAYDMGQPDLIGAGRLNIGNALALVDKNERKILHFGNNENSGYNIHPAQLVNDSQDDFIIVQLNSPYQNNEGVNFDEKKYQALIYKISAKINHTTTDPVLDAWARNSGSNLFSLNTSPPYPIKTSLDPYVDVTINNVDGNSVTMEGYVYQLFDLEADPLVEIGWLPFNIDNLSDDVAFEYSLLVGEPIVSIVESSKKKTYVSIFPNPVHQTLSFYSDFEYGHEYYICIYNAYGEVVHRLRNKGDIKGAIDIGLLPVGFYVFEIIGNDFKSTKSFVKF